MNLLRSKKLKENFKIYIMAKKEKNKYSQKELIEFEKLINEKINKAQQELDFIKESLLRKHVSGTDSTQGALKTLEDGADTMEKESLSQLAGRQQKFILNLPSYLTQSPFLVFNDVFNNKIINFDFLK